MQSFNHHKAVERETKMQRRKDKIRSRRRIGELLAVIMCGMILSGGSVRVPMGSAVTKPQIIIGPSSASLELGQSFILTVNLTDFPNLYSYQVVVTYNGTILNKTGDLIYPGNSVFSGQTAIAIPEPSDIEEVGDTVNFLNYTVAAESLMGESGIAVSNGVLFQVNFTVVGIGTTTVGIATLRTPVQHFTDNWYSLCQDSDLVEYNDFVTKGCTILSGVSSSPPVAHFTIIGAQPAGGNKTNLLLEKNIPPSVTNWVKCWEGLPVLFNASDSYPTTGNITALIWNFGDGNITVVNATYLETDASTLLLNSTVTHVYEAVGSYYMNLTVVGSGTGDSPPLSSRPASQLVLVDLALPYYDWNWLIYTFIVLVVVGVALVVARSTVRRVRKRRKIREQRALTTGP